MLCTLCWNEEMIYMLFDGHIQFRSKFQWDVKSNHSNFLMKKHIFFNKLLNDFHKFSVFYGCCNFLLIWNPSSFIENVAFEVWRLALLAFIFFLHHSLLNLTARAYNKIKRLLNPLRTIDGASFKIAGENKALSDVTRNARMQREAFKILWERKAKLRCLLL